MAREDDMHSDQRRRTADHYETFLHSIALLRGDRLSADQVGRIVGEAVAGASLEELRSSVPPASAIGRIHQLLMQTVEAGRPRNMYGPEAALAAQAGGIGAKGVGSGLGTLDAARNSSARYRELLAESSRKGGGAEAGSAPAPAEFIRSYVGTGLGGGTVQTFAAVGLDRGTYDGFRQEGFTVAQIADNARDVKALRWHGKEDLTIAQHASPEARKAAVATEQAKTPEARAEKLAREAELERKNEARPDSDPRKQYDRRFFERRHQDHLRHSAEAGVGSAWLEKGKAISSPKHASGAGNGELQDRMMAKQAANQTASVKTAAIAGFEVEAETPAPNKPAPKQLAAAKPAAGAPKPA